jgi:adenylate kinase
MAAASQATTTVASSLKPAVQSHASSQFEAAQEPGLRILIFGKPVSFMVFVQRSLESFPQLISNLSGRLRQGSGKGTLSARLVQKYDLEFVASGDVLRREIMNKSDIGRMAEEIVNSGGE